jgi:hypothetical protein
MIRNCRAPRAFRAATFGLLGLGLLGLQSALVPTVAQAAGTAALAPQSQQAKDRATNGSYYWAWWGWEPWEHNRRAGGITGAVDGASTWLHRWYDRLHSEEIVKRMADVGVNMAVTHFFKGFGLQHERGEQQRTAHFVQLAHKHGIRVIGYCQLRSIYYETFLVEEPSAENWIQRDPNGRPVPWNGRYYRWCPCIHSPEFRAYTKRAIRVGLEETGLDGFNFDNCMSAPCYCPRCEQAFRQWMVRRYPQPRELFGIGTLAGVRQPPAPTTSARVEDPLTRAWLRWRCESLADFLGEVTAYARSLRPEAILMANPSYPVAASGPARNSVWPASVGQHLNLMIAENSASPEIAGDTIISQIRAYRHGLAIGYRPVSTTWAGGLGREASPEASSALPQSPSMVKLQVAEAAANRGVPGANWALRPLGGGDRMRIDLPEFQAALRQYLQFVRKHEPLWLTATPINDVVVLRSFASGAFDAQNSWDRAATAEEVLIRGGFCWGAVFDDLPECLKESSALVLAGQTHLDAATCAAVKNYAAAGGGVVVLGDAARWDENGILPDTSPLADLRGPRVIRCDGGTPSLDSHLKHVLAVRLPKDWRKLAEAVEKAAGARWTARLRGSTSVAMSAFRTADNHLAVHLVNYAAPEASGPLRVELGQSWSDRQSARLATPEGEDRALPIVRNGRQASIEVPSLEAYGIVTVR